MNDDLLEYGEKVNSQKLNIILEHIFLRNDKISSEDKRGTPVCIWGTHGLGKTQIVQDFAKQKQWKFVVRDCSPQSLDLISNR